MHWPRLSRCFAACATLLSSASAAADPAGYVDFAWDAPPSCPSGETILAEVAKLSSSAASGQRWHAGGRVDRTPAGGWTLHLTTEVDGRQDARDFAATSCAELAATAAVVLAVAVEPLHPPTPSSLTASPTAPTTAEVDASQVAPPSQVSRPPLRPPLAAPARREPSRLLSFAVTASALGSVGILATPAFGVSAGAAWLPPHARVEIDGLWLPSSEVSGGLPGSGGSFSLLGAAASGCWMPLERRVQVGVCAGVQVGSLAADGDGASVSRSESKREPWVAGTAGGLLVGRLVPHVALRAGLDVVVPFVRNEFVDQIHGVDTAVHTPSPVAAQLTAGVEVAIP